MTAALCVLAVVAIVAIAALSFVAIRSRLGLGPVLVSKTVVIHTTDGQSIRGVLFGQYSDRITLRNATHLHGADEQPIGGLAHVPAGSVSWVQELESVKSE